MGSERMPPNPYECPSVQMPNSGGLILGPQTIPPPGLVIRAPEPDPGTVALVDALRDCLNIWHADDGENGGCYTCGMALGECFHANTLRAADAWLAQRRGTET